MSSGTLICFEGLDGSGKSTQIKLLHTHLEKLGYSVVSLRAPGGNPLCEDIRELIMRNVMDETSEALLMLASHYTLYTMEIEHYLKEGYIVLMDRYLDSCRAYQGTTPTLRTLIEGTIRTLEIPEPDLTLYLNITPRESIRRKLHSSDINRFDKCSLDERSAILSRYNQLIATNPSAYSVMTAMAPVEQLAKQVLTSAIATLRDK